MATPIAELTAETVAEFVGKVGSSIERSVGVVGVVTVVGGPELPDDDIAQLLLLK
jgi:hypothetical protein